MEAKLCSRCGHVRGGGNAVFLDLYSFVKNLGGGRGDRWSTPHSGPLAPASSVTMYTV